MAGVEGVVDHPPKRSVWRKRVTRAALALFFLVLPLVVAEFYYRSLKPETVVLVLTTETQTPLTPELLDLTPCKGDILIHSFEKKRPALITLRRNGPSQFLRHPILFKSLRPQVATRFVKRDKQGTVFDATYSSDEEGRRSGLTRGDKTLLFFGGSICFGSGVDDQQTLPEQTAALLDATAVNYAVGGYGTHSVLYQLEQLPVTSRPEPGRRVIYVFNADHIRRALGYFSSFCWNQGRSPHYLASQDSGPTFVGTWRENHPWRTRFYSLLQRSRLVKRIGLDIPATVGDAEIAAVAELIERCKEVSHTRWSAEFTVLVYPDPADTSELGSRMAVSLLKRGIHVVSGPELGPDLMLPRDGHPSPQAHREVAELLSQALHSRLD